MLQYEVKSVESDGSGVVRVLLDNGMVMVTPFKEMPVDDVELFHDCMCDVSVVVAVNSGFDSPVMKPIDPAVLALKDKPVNAMKPPKAPKPPAGPPAGLPTP